MRWNFDNRRLLTSKDLEEASTLDSDFGRALSSFSAVSGRLPVVTIVTDGAAPILDTTTYVNGDLTITEPGKDTMVEKSLRIRGRGNSTWGRDKKPYRLNFDEKTTVLGMKANQKNWGLIACHFDKSKLAYQLALTMGQLATGLSWTPEYRLCEVVLNDDFLGLYLLTDLVRLDDDRIGGSAVNADTGDGLTGTYLMELSLKDFENGVQGFQTTLGAGLIWDDPEAPTTAQYNYITGYVQAFEDALFSEDFTNPTTGWRAYADENSFADWYLIEEFLRNQDSQQWSSCKIYKPRDSLGGKLHMGPLWDFDLSTGFQWNPDNWIEPAKVGPQGFTTQKGGGFWFARLWLDPDFRATLARRWAKLRAALDALTPDGWGGWLDHLSVIEEEAIRRDDKRWSTNTFTPALLDYRKRWLRHRITWFTEQVETIPDGVNLLPALDLSGPFWEAYWGAPISREGEDVAKVVLPDTAHLYGIIFKSFVIVPKDDSHRYVGSAWVKGPVGQSVRISCHIYNKANQTVSEDAFFIEWAFTGNWQEIHTGDIHFGPADVTIVGGWRPAFQVIGQFTGEFLIKDPAIIRVP